MGNRGLAALAACIVTAVAVSAAASEAALAPDTQVRAAAGCAAVQFGGEGTPDLIIASDLPLTGGSAPQTRQIVSAIRFVLEKQEWMAGEYSVGFQSCDDSTASGRKWDAGQCARNGQRYATTENLIGLIGTFNSGCAAIVIPTVNAAEGGPVPMISPANTYTCLTQAGPGCDATEPRKYYPSGARNYFRLTEHDVYQSVALAQLIRSEKRKRLFILHDNESYGVGVALNTRAAARRLGLRVVGLSTWNLRGDNRALMQRIRASGADAILLAGLLEEAGDSVIRDKVAVLGPNRGPGSRVFLYASDGFTTHDTLDYAGQASYGMLATVGGVPTSRMPASGRAFAASFLPRLGGAAVDPYAVYGAAAAQTLLAAVARSDGTRESVLSILRRLKLSTTLGTVSFRPNGDPNFSVGFTAYRMGGDGLTEFRVIRAQMPVVRAISR